MIVDTESRDYAVRLYDSISRLIVTDGLTPREVMIDLDIQLASQCVDCSKTTIEAAFETRRLAASMAVTIFEMHRSKMLLTRDEYLAILRAEGVVKTVKLVDAVIEKHCGKFA